MSPPAWDPHGAPVPPPSGPPGRLRVCWLRTSCLLLQAEGSTAITDPWFGSVMRVLPTFHPTGIARRDLPPIDAVFASHLHADHFSARDVRAFGHPGLTVVGTPGTAARHAELAPRHAASVHDLPAGASLSVGPWTVHAVPCEHTGPPPAEVNYVIDVAGRRVFFGGDARRSEHHAAIARRFPGIDLALLPVGGTLIFGHRTTLSPDDAVAVCAQLKPRWALPIHEGGEWLPLPPMSWHPGRTRHFHEALRLSGLPTRGLVAPRGAWVELDGDFAGRAA